MSFLEDVVEEDDCDELLDVSSSICLLYLNH